MAKPTLSAQVAQLRREIAALRKRVKALEEQRAAERVSAIGFEVDYVECEDDESEYRRK